jgi:hypothetical protein
MRVEKLYRTIAGSLVFVLFLMTSQPVYSQHHTVTIKILDSVLLPVGNATIKINQKAMVADSTGIISSILPDGKPPSLYSYDRAKACYKTYW